MKTPIFLGTVAVLATQILAQDRQAAFNGYCNSINLSTGTASALGVNLTMYFTTYDGSPGIPLYDDVFGMALFSGELNQAPNAPGKYQTDYVLFANNQVNATGTISVDFPSTDADQNGVADFLQKNQSGNVSFSGAVVRQIPSAAAATPFSGSITRSPGSLVGSYAATGRDAALGLVTYRGLSYLINATGSIRYNRSNNSCTIMVEVANFDGTVTSYSTSPNFGQPDSNTVAFPSSTLVSSSLRTLTVKPFTLKRSGNRYTGPLELQDGEIGTSWRDYTSWQVEIVDPNDSDADGIPDLSDPSPTPAPPTILVNPTSHTKTVGQATSLTVQASGGGQLSYQWKKGGSPINDGTTVTGTKTSVISFSSLQLSHAGDYSVTVSNSAGTVNSATAALTVLPLAISPTITTQPQAVVVNVGQTAEMSVVASGTAPLSYQWQRNGTPIQGATLPVLAISNAQPANAGQYQVLVTNPAGSILSTAASLTINQVATPPTITLQPSSISVVEGMPFTLSVGVTGTPPLAFQWRRNNTSLQGGTSGQFTVQKASPENAGIYSVQISNAQGTVTSANATVAVNPSGIAMRITSIRLNPSGSVEMNVFVNPGRDYILESGTNLASWTTVQSFKPALPQASLSMALPETRYRYFRLRDGSAGPGTPVIIQQPSSVSVVLGKPAALSVKAEGTGPFTYLWYKNGNPMPGKTSPSLTFSAAKTSDSGIYWCVISNALGTTTSDSATLTVEGG